MDIDFAGTLSEDKKSVVVQGKYICYLDVRNNSLDSSWCDLPSQDNFYLAYRTMLNGARHCVAKGERAEDICKVVGGENPYDNGIGLMHYRLP